jgi:uncharacterized protein YgbK (DUF1537 family)
MPPGANRTELAPPTFAGSPFSRIVLLAGDLAGACGSAAAFIRTGRTVRVWFGPGVLFSAPETVQAFSTNSRPLSPLRASRVVSQAAKALGSDPFSLFFKHVDPTARGPAGAEILAAHRALSTRAVFFAPAFPSAGFTVHNGVSEIHDFTGGRKKIRLAGLFPPTVWSRIAFIASPSHLQPALESGKTILVCDSATQAELEALARAAQQFSGLLHAGCAGLAHALAGLNPAAQPPALMPRAERTLVIAGSLHPVTKLQLQALDHDRFPGVRLMHHGIPVAARVRIRFAFRSFAPQALVLAGGETALLALQALDAHSVLLQGELAPGVPWGLIQGGLAHGCVVVTKSRSAGARTVFNEILSAVHGSA